MEKLVITACICGAEVTKEMNPNIPYTVDEMGNEALRAYNAGASIIHLHVREDDGTPTQDINRFRIVIEEIKRKCPDIIIEMSTGGALGMSLEERIQCLDLRPEMATIDFGSCNFDEEVFVNTFPSLRTTCAKVNELDIIPIIGIMDKGMIDSALRLQKEGYIKNPMNLLFVQGVKGGISGEPRDMMYLSQSMPYGSTFTSMGVGRCQIPLTTMSIIMGGHVRVGFEDNIYLEKGVLANSNGELVEKIVRIAKELGREIASPEDARRIFKVKN